MATEPTPPSDLDHTLRNLAPGYRFAGRYRLESVLGRGAMGIVWRALDETLERPVALKFLVENLVHDPMAIDDLKRETRRALELTHHNIVRVYDFVEDASRGLAGIAMEFFPGKTLAAARIADPRRYFEPAQIAPWIAQLCDALSYAHEKGFVIHRDLKPQNLMLDERGELKVTDFGIARVASDSMTRITIGKVSGTPCYMSPQQSRGEAPAVTDDIYAIGATMYELLTSRPPFWQGNVALQLEVVTPPPMVERREELTGTASEIAAIWEDTVAACLSKDASVRPPSVRDLAHRLGLSLPSTTFNLLATTPTRPGTKPMVAAPEPVEEALPADAPTMLGGVDFSSSGPTMSMPVTPSAPVTPPPEVARPAATPSSKPRESKAWRSLPPVMPPPLPASSQSVPPPAAPAPIPASEPIPPQPQYQPQPPYQPVSPTSMPVTPISAPAYPQPPRRGMSMGILLTIVLVLFAGFAFVAGALIHHFLSNQGGGGGGKGPFVIPDLTGPKTLVVPDQYASIQAAIDAAKGGDTVSIRAGSYVESLVLRDSIRLVGEGVESTRIQAPSGSASNLFARGVRGCTVENLTFAGTGATDPNVYTVGWTLADDKPGVVIREVAPDSPAAKAGLPVGAVVRTIDGQSVELATEAPYLLAGRATEHDCVVEFERAGVRQSASVHVQRLATKDAWPDGLVISNAEVRVSHCVIDGMGGVGALVIGKNARVELSANRFLNGQQHGVSLLRTSSSVVLTGNEMSGSKGSGLRFEESDGLVSGNTLERNGSVGILVSGTSSAPTLKSNQCRHNRNSGIYYAEGTGGIAEENVCESNEDSGVLITGSNASPTLRSNRCIDNKKNGIFITQGARGQLEKNVIERNGFPGICVQGAGTAPVLRGNESRSNQQAGILFTEGASGTADHNLCENNMEAGIVASGRGTSAKLVANQCRSNKDNGITVHSQGGAQVSGNECTKNGADGIGVTSGATATLEDNTCADNTTHGISFAAAARGAVNRNICQSNGDSGLAAFGEGTAPVFSANQAVGNAHYGIYFGSGADGSAISNVCSDNQFSGIGIAKSGSRPTISSNQLRQNTKFGIESFEGASPKISQDNTFEGNGSGTISR